MHDYFFIIGQLVHTDFKLKYNNSFLGYFWSLLNPLIYYVVLLFVFTYAFNTDIEKYSLYLIVGIFLYSFFSDCSKSTMAALVDKKALLTNLKIPFFVIIFSSSLISVLTLLLNFLIIIGFLVFCDVPIGFNVVKFVAVLPVFYLISFSIGLLLAKFYVKYRDLEHIYENLITIGFWVTPVVYSFDVVPHRFLFLYFLNPVTRIIVYSRDVLIYDRIPEYMSIQTTAIGAVLLFLVSLLVYSLSVRKVTDYL